MAYIGPGCICMHEILDLDPAFNTISKSVFLDGVKAFVEVKGAAFLAQIVSH